MIPTRSKFTILKQICNLIPPHLVPKLAHKHGVDKKARTFSPWSQVVAMLHCQLAHSLSLNDICDTLRNHSGTLSTIRRATPPSRNGLSHANRNRNADLAEELFYEVLEHLQTKDAAFGKGHKYSGLPRRFKRTIVAVDSTVIQLVANCIDWAKHRRRKAAAKCHMQLNLQTFLPQFAIVKAANTHDSTEAKELCANIKDGEIAVFDKAYNDFKHLFHLMQRGVFWVLRVKDNMQYETMGQHRAPSGAIIRDVMIRLTGVNTQDAYPEAFRLVEADVVVNNVVKRMTFITNNLMWASSSICDLYKSRWCIEVFFKQIKQTLQLSDFMGHNVNAVRWQVWTALLAYVLLRFIGHHHSWQGTFKRLFTLVRGVLYSLYDLETVLEICGTAGGSSECARGSPSRSIRMIASPEQAYLPGFEKCIEG